MNQENPQSLPSPQYRIKKNHRKASIHSKQKDIHLDTEVIRLQTQACAKKSLQIWNSTQSQVIEFFVNYESLPQSKIIVKNLIEVGSKVVKADSKIYIGQIVSRKKEGKGVTIYKNGKIFEGEFVANQKNGYGCELFENGNLYCGEYHQNKKHGDGSFYWFNLCDPACIKTASPKIEQYHGKWWGGLPDGNGTHQKANGDYYVGTFKNGLKHGEGKQIYMNGDIYEGQFINGLPQGYGQYKWIDGSIYKGDFKQGYRNGYGMWQSSDKKQRYKGHYLLDQKHGYGVHEYLVHNEVYKGQYVQDLRCGEGQLYLNGEIQYTGLWQNGQRLEKVSKLKKKSKNYMTSQKLSTKEDRLTQRQQSKEKSSPINRQSQNLFKIKTNKPKYITSAKRDYSTTVKKPRINSSSCETTPYGHRKCVACCKKTAEMELKKFDQSFS